MWPSEICNDVFTYDCARRACCVTEWFTESWPLSFQNVRRFKTRPVHKYAGCFSLLDLRMLKTCFLKRGCYWYLHIFLVLASNWLSFSVSRKKRVKNLGLITFVENPQRWMNHKLYFFSFCGVCGNNSCLSHTQAFPSTPIGWFGMLMSCISVASYSCTELESVIIFAGSFNVTHLWHFPFLCLLCFHLRGWLNEWYLLQALRIP